MTEAHNNITPSQMAEYLDKKSDFSLEMRVFSFLKTRCRDIAHGGTYKDPVTKKPRQFDLRCVFERGKSRYVRMAIECKNISRDFPLVIQRVRRQSSECFHHVAVTHPWAAGFNHYAQWYPIYSCPFKELFYPLHEYVGKSMQRIGLNKKGDLHSSHEEIYKKWEQAIASSHDLLADSFSDELLHQDNNTMSAILPAVVVPDNTLFAVDYDKNGERKSEPVIKDNIPYYIGKNLEIKRQDIATTSKVESIHENVSPYRISHIHFLTETGLRNFVPSHSGLDESNFPWLVDFSLEQMEKIR